MSSETCDCEKLIVRDEDVICGECGEHSDTLECADCGEFIGTSCCGATGKF